MALQCGFRIGTNHVYELADGPQGPDFNRLDWEKHMKSRMQKGFTLVEIAIVLVIVGLLIGGVLKGQEMITNAKLKRIESDNAGIAAAMFSYQDRYLQLPGDDNNAVSRFTDYAATSLNGNGDGTINGVWNANNISDLINPGGATPVETDYFFAHLRAAGLVPGSALDATKPTNAYGGLIGIQDGADCISGHVTIFGTIEGSIAAIIESRLDDGDPNRGRIQSENTNNGNNMQPLAAANCPQTAGGTYNNSSRYNMAFRL